MIMERIRRIGIEVRKQRRVCFSGKTKGKGMAMAREALGPTAVVCRREPIKIKHA